MLPMYKDENYEEEALKYFNSYKTYIGRRTFKSGDDVYACGFVNTRYGNHLKNVVDRQTYCQTKYYEKVLEEFKKQTVNRS